MIKEKSQSGSTSIANANYGMQKKQNFLFDFITAKGSGKLNEDSFITDSNAAIFAVFDGVSGLTSFADDKGRTGAFLASNIARETFENDKKGLLDLTFETNAKIRDKMLQEGIDTKDKINLWGTYVAAVKINENTFDWVQVGDSIILIIYKDNSHKILVNDYDHDKETLMHMKELIAKGVKNPRDAISEDLAELRRKLNITYGVVAGEREIKFLYSGTEKLKDIKSILIFSDGLLIPKEDPNQKDDFSTIVEEYQIGGLRGWLEYVRNIENGDPDFKRYVRYKNHDDATGIAISFK